MIPHLFLLLSILLLLSLFAGLLRLFLSRDNIEHIIAMQLMGTTSVAILLLLSLTSPLLGNHIPYHGTSSILDIALITALLASITSCIFVQKTREHAPGSTQLKE